MKIVEFLSYLNSLDIKLWLEDEKLKYQAPKGAITPEIKQAIKQRKPDILAFLAAGKTTVNKINSTIIPVSRNKVLPLSFAQQRLWFLHQLSPDSQSYNLLEAMSLKGTLDQVALEKSLTELLHRHEILRTTFPMVNGQPIQNIAAPSPVSLSCEDLQGLSSDEQMAQFRELAIAIATQPFNLAQGPLIQFRLLKLGTQDHILLLKMHHIIYDGWSLSIFFRELSQLYHCFSQGLPSPLSPLSIQYADFAVWQRQWLTGEVLDKQLNYWREQLENAPLVLEIPTDHPRPPVQTFQGDGQSFWLEGDLSEKLKQLSHESGTTLFMTLLSAFFILLSRYSGQKDLIVGSPIANRNNPAIEELMGFFANTLALRGELSGNPTFLELLERVKRTTLAAYSHQDLPFEMLVEKMQPERDLSRNPVIQVMFSLQNTPQTDSSLSGLKIENMPLPIDIKARFDLEVNFWETTAGLEGVWVYNSDLFEATTITRMGNHFNNLVKAIIANPQAKISELSLLNLEEYHQLITQWNASQTDYPDAQCIHQLFEKQVTINPDAVAVVFEDKSLTYKELNAQANQLAHYLLSLGVKPDDLVGICLERSLELIVGLLAILKAGGAYVPIDSNYPSERLSFLFEDTQIKILLTQSQIAESLPPHSAQIVCLELDWAKIQQNSQDNPNNAVTADNLAYVIYTSGSTGIPKGVKIAHRSVNRLLFGVNYVKLDADERILQMAPIVFDASTFEIWGALLRGGRCVLFPDSIPSAQTLKQTIEKEGITTLWLTAALFNVIIDENPQALSKIKQLLIGGEALSVNHVQKALLSLPSTQIINGYGPTESTTFTCCYPIPRIRETSIDSIPIGRPISNTQIYLLDEYLQPVPIGVIGELYIGGAGLAQGYLNRPELTTEKFISNPFEESGDSKLYKTGDLARYLPDGNIEYIGRIDHQVKIRGFRIELGEIEAILSQHHDVKVACVIVREDTPGDKRLVAYIVPPTEAVPNISELRQFLKSKLPDYMIPSAFEILESLPLTPNGKVDRRALKAPTYTVDQDRLIKPRNQLEFKLAQIWSNTLKIDQVGVQDNFFELGGHSLLAPYLMTQIQQELGKELPLMTLFDNPTIEQLAITIQQRGDETYDSRLVAIQLKGSLSPFFCVPGVGGKPFYLHKLGTYLGENQPLYGFQAYDTLDGESEVLTRIEDIASHYLQAMQAIQPQGPYFLGGHSFGGKVAFEMARQLHYQQQEIGLVVMIDAQAPTPKEKPLLSYYQKWDHSRWLMELVESVGMAISNSLEITYNQLKKLTLEKQFTYVLQQFKTINALPPNTEIKHLKKMMEVYKANSLATTFYLPQEVYPFPIVMLRAEEIPPDDAEGDLFVQIYSKLAQESTLGWNQFSSQPVDVYVVPGNHVSMMLEPNIQVLAKQLKICLEKAQTKGN